MQVNLLSFTPKDKHSHLWPLERKERGRKKKNEKEKGKVEPCFSCTLPCHCHFTGVMERNTENTLQDQNLPFCLFSFFLLVSFYQFVQNCPKWVGLLSNSITVWIIGGSENHQNKHIQSANFARSFWSDIMQLLFKAFLEKQQFPVFILSSYFRKISLICGSRHNLHDRKFFTNKRFSLI